MITPEKSDRVQREIKSALALTGMTQKALAKKLRCTERHLSYRMQNPSTIGLNELDEICKALNMTITFGKGK